MRGSLRTDCRLDTSSRRAALGRSARSARCAARRLQAIAARSSADDVALASAPALPPPSLANPVEAIAGPKPVNTLRVRRPTLGGLARGGVLVSNKEGVERHPSNHPDLGTSPALDGGAAAR
jgi:hypothetical protein